MRRLLPALLAVCAAALLTAFALPPKAKPPALSAQMYPAGPLLWVRWTVAATPSDSLTVDVSATGKPSVHKMYTVDSKVDSTSYPKPTPGASITVSLLATNWRGVKPAAAPIATGTYVEPDTLVSPPAVKLELIPASATLAPGGQQQFCVVFTYADGSTGLSQETAPVAACQTAYQTWLQTHPV